MARKVRGFESLGDIVRSLGVVLVVVACLYGLVTWYRPEPDPVRTIDWQSTLRAARADAPFAVLAPEGLSTQWRATSAEYEPAGPDGVTRWSMGYVSPDDTFVGLRQADEDLDEMLAAAMPARTDDGTVVVRGQTWQRQRETGVDLADRALVLIRDGPAGDGPVGDEQAGDEQVVDEQVGDERAGAGVTTVVLGSGDYAELESFASSLR